MKRKKAKGTWHTIGGAVGGGIASIIGQPFDVIKTTMIGPDAKVVIRNPITAAKTVVNQHGFTGLYKGIVPTSIRVFPAAGLYFYLMHVFRTNLQERTGKVELSPLQNFGIGITSRAIASFTFNPIFVVKTRFEYGLATNNSVYDTFKYLIQNNKLFSGAFSAVMRDAPYAGMMYMFYSKLNHLFAKWTGLSLSAVSLPASCIASVSAVSITHPFDVIRTRIQLQQGNVQLNMKDAFLQILQEDGVTGLWRGILMRVAKKAFVTSTCWQIYELFIDIMGKREEE